MPHALGGQKRASDSLELVLLAAVGCHVGAGPNLGPLGEQPVLLTVEPPASQSLPSIFCPFSFIHTQSSLPLEGTLGCWHCWTSNLANPWSIPFIESEVTPLVGAITTFPVSANFWTHYKVTNNL